MKVAVFRYRRVTRGGGCYDPQHCTISCSRAPYRSSEIGFIETLSVRFKLNGSKDLHKKWIESDFVQVGKQGESDLCGREVHPRKMIYSFLINRRHRDIIKLPKGDIKKFQAAQLGPRSTGSKPSRRSFHGKAYAGFVLNTNPIELH